MEIEELTFTDLKKHLELERLLREYQARAARGGRTLRSVEQALFVASARIREIKRLIIMIGCEDCDGDGYVWNNADPTSGQFDTCKTCCQGIPEGPDR